ncbi:MAG: hypothetical protein AAGI88_24610 [Pseudomonadota bacterium]
MFETEAISKPSSQRSVTGLAHQLAAKKQQRIAFLILAFFLVLPACSSQPPCLQYSREQVTRTVYLRGYGSMQVSKLVRVCTARADAPDPKLEDQSGQPILTASVHPNKSVELQTETLN